MPTTADISLDNFKLKVLVYGVSGIGKTSFAGTFPRPFFFDFDDGILTLRDHQPPITYMPCWNTYSAKGKITRRGISMFESAFWEVAQSPDYDTIVVDGLTSMADSILQDALRLNNRKLPTYDEWNELIRRVKEILDRFKVVDKHVVVTALEHMLQDDLSGEIHILPLLTTKKLPPRLPGFFDEVYRAVVGKVKEGESKYSLLTRATRKYSAKSRLSRFGILDEREEPDFNVIMGKVKEAALARAAAQKEKGELGGKNE